MLSISLVRRLRRNITAEQIGVRYNARGGRWFRATLYTRQPLDPYLRRMVRRALRATNEIAAAKRAIFIAML